MVMMMMIIIINVKKNNNDNYDNDDKNKNLPHLQHNLFYIISAQNAPQHSDTKCIYFIPASAFA